MPGVPPQLVNSVPWLGLLGAVIAAYRRKLPIGGWLFFFFWGIFVGMGVTLLNVYNQRAYFLPRSWADQTKYLMFMLALCPGIGSSLFVAAASGVLIRRRDWQSVQTLRAGLIAYLISTLLRAVIVAFYFPSFTTFSAADLSFPALFLIYSFRSQRMVRVFGTATADRT